ncbi:MAG: amidase [Deltaproteobacteria bacterium]|nr:amidase [Deltaproteobacteria bacterium]
MADIHDYTDCDATELAARIARGEVSPSEVLETAIAAVERVNPQLNAVVHRMYDEARAMLREPLPDGPFRGVPMVVKDFDGFIKGVPFTGSCRFLEGYLPDHDSELFARLRRAGFLFIAKTNCPELALMGTTEPKWRGPTRNPYNLARSTGGSSGGSAALVAARAVPVGHGGDGGGSLRIPASSCGLVGLKATRARIPLGPDYAEVWGGYTQWGVLSRSVRDTATVFDAIAGPTPGDPYAAPLLPKALSAEVGRDPGRLQIGFHAGTLFGREVDSQHADAVRRAAAQLEALGHHLEADAPKINREQLVRAYLTQVAVSVASEIEEFSRLSGRRPSHDLFEPETWLMNQIGQATSALELVRARDAAQAAGRATAEFHKRYDLFLCPTTAFPPVGIGELDLGAAKRTALALLRQAPFPPLLRKVLDVFASSLLERTPNTQLFNQTGQPAISLPLAQTTDEMPIGIQLAAPLGREDLLIRVAAQLEAAHPWIARRPRISA